MTETAKEKRERIDRHQEKRILKALRGKKIVDVAVGGSTLSIFLKKRNSLKIELINIDGVRGKRPALRVCLNGKPIFWGSSEPVERQ